jgi:hypothetical protein
MRFNKFLNYEVVTRALLCRLEFSGHFAILNEHSLAVLGHIINMPKGSPQRSLVAIIFIEYQQRKDQRCDGCAAEMQPNECWEAILATTGRLALSGSRAHATHQRARQRTQRARKRVSMCDVRADAPLMTIVVLRRLVNRY